MRAFALLTLGWLLSTPALTADEEEGATTSTLSSTELVELSPLQEEMAGVITHQLEPSHWQIESLTHGRVLDVQPLLDLRTRLRSAQADAEVAQAALKLADKDRQRIQALHRADILAGRELIRAETQWQSDRAREEAARRRVDELRREALHQWGPELTRRIIQGNAPLLESLASHQRYLIQVTLPPGLDQPLEETPLYVARDHDRAHALPAQLISTAPYTDDLVQGETWYYHTSAGHLRSGMRVNVWIPEGDAVEGVWICNDSVVWLVGKPWIYKRISPGRYRRVAIEEQSDIGNRRFIRSGIRPGDEVVVKGAQTLLSEEFKQQIPDDDDQ